MTPSIFQWPGATAAVLMLVACQPRQAALLEPVVTPAARPMELAALPLATEAVQRLMEKRVKPAFVPGEVLVKMKPSARAPISANDLTRLQLVPAAQLTSGGERVLRVAAKTAGEMTPQALRERTLQLVKLLAARTDVQYAQPNHVLQLSARPNDPGFVQQWNFLDSGVVVARDAGGSVGKGAGLAAGGINLAQVWDGNKGSSSVVVAVIDTGILSTHPDIAGSPNLVAGFDMIDATFNANDGGGRDSDPTDPGDAASAGECGDAAPAHANSWHGTHVAGIVGVGHTNNGVGVAGINWSVQLQPVRVLGKCGATLVDVIDAIRWAAGLPVPGVPDNLTPARVINLSLAGAVPCSAAPAMQSAINDAVARGVTVVAAAGSEAADVSGFVPASCNGVISVAASDARGRLVTRYSNFGARVDLLAPGGDTARDDDNDGHNDGVLSMVLGGYARYNGTSMASAHVAGVVALMRAVRPTLSPAAVLAELQRSAVPRSAVECPQACGAGLLNARAALAP
jgi:serine protease